MTCISCTASRFDSLRHLVSKIIIFIYSLIFICYHPGCMRLQFPPCSVMIKRDSCRETYQRINARNEYHSEKLQGFFLKMYHKIFWRRQVHGWDEHVWTIQPYAVCRPEHWLRMQVHETRKSDVFFNFVYITWRGPRSLNIRSQHPSPSK
jgi:hypothetical protein